MKMNSEYFVALARTFEKRYGVAFQGITQGPTKDTRDRLIQYKTNLDVVMSVLDKNGLGDWLADHLVEIGDSLRDDLPLRIPADRDPFLDDRLRVKNLPVEPQKVKASNAVSGAEKDVGITLFRKAGRGRRHAARDLRDRQVAQLRHRQSHAHDRRRPVGVDQSRARQHLGPLRPGDQSARHAHQGGDSGSRQRVDGDRPGQSERVARSREVRRRLGHQRHLRRVHAADVHAGARLESAESGQQVPDGRAAHPRRALGPGDRGRRPHALRHLRAAGVEALPARPGDSPELLGLQRRGAGLLRGGRDRRARSEGRHHHARSRQAGLPGRRSRDVRRHGSPGGGQGLLRHSRLRAGPAAAWLRGHAGIELHGESGQRAADARSRRRQREGRSRRSARSCSIVSRRRTGMPCCRPRRCTT